MLLAVAVNGGLLAVIAQLNAHEAPPPEKPGPRAVAWAPEPPARPRMERVDPRRERAEAPLMTVPLDPSPPEPVPLSPLSAGVPLVAAHAEPVVFQGGAGVVVKDRLDQVPRERANTLPRYPRSARASGEEGTVWVRLLIDERGRVAEARLKRVIGDPAFGQAVLDAARDWRFEPARHRGLPVRVWGIKTVRFELAGGGT
jgi:protein TonB